MSDWGTTHRVPAAAVTAEGLVVEGDLHLMSRIAYPPGPETPLDMLNRPEQFFALTAPSGGVIFVSKAQVAVVTCPTTEPPVDPDRASAAKRIELEVVLAGGDEHRGRATVELPPSRSRALDYVNGLGGFFALSTGEATHYINKAFVRSIRPLD